MTWRTPCWALALVGCIPDLPDPPTVDDAPLQVGESREVVLHGRRLDVTDLAETIDLDALHKMPPAVLDRIWLLDLELTSFVANALETLDGLDTQAARQLSRPAANLRTLLRTTPDNARLEGTSLEELVGLSAALGIPPARMLASLLDQDVTAPVIDRVSATDALVDGLLGSHPATAWRQGPVDDDHPDGLWPVAPRSLPITLGDVVTGFAALEDRLGPADTEWGLHPGVLSGVDGVEVVTEDFHMVARVDVNALPYPGVDLTNATVGAVNSTPSQVGTMFRTDQDDWLTLHGLAPEPRIGALTLTVVEDGAFHTAARDPEPAPRGGGTAWSLPPWTFERVVAQMSWQGLQRIPPHCVAEVLGADTVVFEGCVGADGWTTFQTFAGLGAPPHPAYVWDLVLELAQVRLHDGGLREGDADVALTLHDVPLGIDAEALGRQAAQTLAADPTVLRDLARVLTENGRGLPDVYYVRGPDEGPPDEQGDWLWFLLPEDVPLDTIGEPSRAYGYDRIGFFADPGLTQELSATQSVWSDRHHPKVRLEIDQPVHVQDDHGRVYEIRLVGKDDRATIRLRIRRLR